MKRFLFPLVMMGLLFAGNAKDAIPTLTHRGIETFDADKAGAISPVNGEYSFETESGWKASIPEEFAYTSEASRDGIKSGHIVRSNDNVALTLQNENPFPIEPGERYRVGFYYSSKNSYGVNLTLNVTTLDSSGSTIRTITGPYTRLNGDSAYSEWTEFFLEFQSKSTAASAKVDIVVGYGSSDLYVDSLYCVKTGDDVYDETFSFPKEDMSFPNWDLKQAKGTEGGELEILPEGTAKTVCNRFQSGCGYALTFDARGKEGEKAQVLFETFDSAHQSIQKITKEITLTESMEQKSVEITLPRGIKTYISFENQSSESLFIDNVHATMTYSPNETAGWQGKWITYPDKDVTSDAQYQNRWYRKTFELTEKVASASLQLTADDVRFTFVNGKAYGRGGSWAVPTIIDITNDLVVGKNVLAARVFNGTYYSGLLFEATIVTESGRVLSIYSDKETLCSKTTGKLEEQYITGEEAEEWIQPDFDDSSWVKSYVVGEVGCMPWGSIPFVSLASTSLELELVDIAMPSECVLGDTLTFTASWKPAEKIEKPLDLSVSFWGKYSSDIDDAPIQSSLRQVQGPAMAEWIPNQANEVTYEVDVPDYMEEGSYFFQFDTEKIKIVNNDDYMDNKIRGHYVSLLPTEIHLDESKVVRKNNSTILEIGGKNYAPYLWMQSDGLNYFKPVYAQKMYDAGVKLIALGNNKVVDNISGASTWTDEGKYNFDPFDERIYTTLSGAPKAKIMVMISCDPPSWWLNRYPEERALSAKGGTDSVSYSSKRWVKDVCDYIRAVLEHMKAQPYAAHIFAVKFAQGATYEWQEYGMELGNCADFSKLAQNRFREFLTEKYKTDSALQKAWGDSSLTLSNATIPSYGEREPSTYPSLLDGVKQRNVMDYQEFKSTLVTNSIYEFSSVVKEVSGGKWLAGTYQGYITNALTYESSGIYNSLFSKFLDPSFPIDFFCGPISYMTRQSGYSNSYMQTVTSIVNAGKLCMAEFDERTVKVDMPDQNPSTMDEWGKTYSIEDTINLMKRDMGNTMITGAAAWIYDMTGGWYHDDEIYYCCYLMMKEWEYSWKLDNENNHEVAFVIEDNMPHDYAYNFGASYSALEVNLSRQKEDLAHIGVGYDTLLASDFKKGFEKDYKVYLIVGNRFDQTTREAIKNKVRKSGSSVIWCGTPGIYGDEGDMSATNISDLVDMDVSLVSGTPRTAVKSLAESEDPLLQDMKGFTYGKSEIAEVSPVAKVMDANAVALGNILGSEDIGLAYKKAASKDGGTYTTVFSSIGHVPAMFVRNLLLQEGGHVYDDSYSDVVFSSNAYLCIDSPYGGERTIRLPKAYDVVDVFAGRLIGENITSFETTLEAKTTYLYRLMPAGSYGKEENVSPNEPNEPTVPTVKKDWDAVLCVCGAIGGAEVVAMSAVLIAALIKKKKTVK